MSKKRIWTQEEIDQIDALRRLGTPSWKIAKQFNVSSGRISNLATMWGLPIWGTDKPREPQPPQWAKWTKVVKEDATKTPKYNRKCLQCRKPFETLSNLIFLCDKCKDQESWKAGI